MKLDSAPKKTLSPLLRYGAAPASVAIMIGLRLLLDPVLGSQFPFVTLFLAVLLTAWYGGFGPALTATLLGAPAAAWLFLPPRGTFAVAGIENQARLALYVAAGLSLALLGGAMRDGRRRAEASAQDVLRQREQLKLVTDNAPVLLTHCDTERRFKFVNRAYAERFGLHPSDIVGKSFAEALGREAADAIEPHVRAVLAGQRVEFEIEVPYRDLGPQHMHCAYEPEIDSTGKVVGFVAVGHNVSARKQAECTARFLADASVALAAVVDYESCLQKVAQLAVPHFADWCTADMLETDGTVRRLAVAHVDPGKAGLAHELLRRIPHDPAAPHGVWRVLRTGAPEIIPEITAETLAAIATDGEALRILRDLGMRSYIGAPLTVRDRPIGVLSFVIAESGRRFSAADLAVAEDLARRAAVAIENARLYQALREADRRKDEFLALLGHELRNPLAPILNGLHLLKLRQGDPAAAERTRAMMERQAEHMVRLVNDLLDVSRIMRGKVELRREPLDLAAVIARAVATVQPVINAAGHELVISVSLDPLWVSGDVVRLAQVIANLLDNAAKYMGRGGTISLSAAREAGQAVVRVGDTGIGIAQEALPRLFDMFYQGERSTIQARGGLGIGLSLVRGLVELHGGIVEAHSAGPGTGSEFVVRLPLLAGEEEDRAEVVEQRPAGHLPRRRVLVVDDNADAADSLAMLLEEEGQEVSVAYDGPSGLAQAEARPPDLAILDLGMPGMDGYELARRIRAHPGLRGVVLVAVTGWGQPEDRQRSRDAGFDRHLVKPVAPEALQSLIGGRWG